MNAPGSNPITVSDAALLLVCRGPSCRERAGSDWGTRLAGRAHCQTSCQGRCATGPNALLTDGAQLLTAAEWDLLAADPDPGRQAGTAQAPDQAA